MWCCSLHSCFHTHIVHPVLADLVFHQSVWPVTCVPSWVWILSTVDILAKKTLRASIGLTSCLGNSSQSLELPSTLWTVANRNNFNFGWTIPFKTQTQIFWWLLSHTHTHRLSTSAVSWLARLPGVKSVLVNKVTEKWKRVNQPELASLLILLLSSSPLRFSRLSPKKVKWLYY